MQGRKIVSTLSGIAMIGFATGSAFAAGPEASPSVDRSLADWYEMGGAAMHGLALCSVLVVALIGERLWALRSGATLPRALDLRVRGVVEGDNPLDLKRDLDVGGSALARIAAQVLRPEATLESVEACGEAEVHRLQRNLPLLSAVGNLATMIGLLGTVMGMIEAFDMITVSGTGDARVVAGGIFRALVTTAGGLGVGIAGLAAHALLSRLADERSAMLEERAAELFACVHRRDAIARLELGRDEAGAS